MSNKMNRSARMPEKFFFVPCQIERGGFSSERTFEISVGSGELIGTAHISYLRDENGGLLDDNTPMYGTKISGLVQCRVIEQADSQNLIEVPSADVIYVPSDALVSIE